MPFGRTATTLPQTPSARAPPLYSPASPRANKKPGRTDRAPFGGPEPYSAAFFAFFAFLAGAAWSAFFSVPHLPHFVPQLDFAPHPQTQAGFSLFFSHFSLGHTHALNATSTTPDNTSINIFFMINSFLFGFAFDPPQS